MAPDRSGKTGGGFHARWDLRGCAFGITKKGSADLRELHKFSHDALAGLYVKLVDTHTIEWVFGGTDVDVFKAGKPFSVRGVT